MRVDVRTPGDASEIYGVVLDTFPRNDVSNLCHSTASITFTDWQRESALDRKNSPKRIPFHCSVQVLANEYSHTKGRKNDPQAIPHYFQFVPRAVLVGKPIQGRNRNMAYDNSIHSFLSGYSTLHLGNNSVGR